MNNINNFILSNITKHHGFLITTNILDEELLFTLKEALLQEDIYIDDDLSIFYVKNLNEDLQEIIHAINEDIGSNYKLNISFRINKNTDVDQVIEYIEYVKKYFSITNKDYSTFLSIVSDAKIDNKKEYLDLINNLVIKEIINDERYYETLNVYFKNNLNVLKTSKDLYQSRSSVNFKFDNLKKKYNIDMQKLEDICAMYIILENK